MSTRLLPLMLSALRTKADTPTSEYWLPTVLIKAADGGRPLLPITAEHWTLEEITGEGGKTLVNTVADAGSNEFPFVLAKDGAATTDFTLFPHPDANRHWPSATLTDLTIDGLANAWIGPELQVDENQTTAPCVIPLEISHYTDQPTLPSQLSIATDYQLTIWLGISDEQSDPPRLTQRPSPVAGYDDWPSLAVTAHGHLVLTLTATRARVELELSVSTSPTRAITAEVGTVALTATPTTAVGLDPNRLTVLSVGGKHFGDLLDANRPHIIEALTSQETRDMLLDRLNTALRLPEHRKALSAGLTGQLRGWFDKIFGPVPASGLAAGAGGGYGAVSAYVLDRLRTALADHDSRLFAPAIALSAKDPRIEPYTVADPVHIDTGDAKVHDVVLTDVTVRHLSNLTVRAMTPTTDGFAFVIDLGAITTSTEAAAIGQQVPLPPITISATLNAKVGSQTLEPGTAAAALQRATLNITTTVTGDDPASLTVRLDTLTPQIDAADLTITVDIAKVFNGTIATVLNSAEHKKTFLDRVTAGIAGQRERIGRELTTYLRDALTR